MIGLHMLHPLASASSSSSAAMPTQPGKLRSSVAVSTVYQHQYEPNIVRIPANTSMPIVSSVPKCRNSKGSRSYVPLSTVNGAYVQVSDDHQIQVPIMPTASHAQVGSYSSNNNNKSARYPDDERVLLIVNDDHIKGGGVPIMGRRLPSKSMAARSSSVYHQHQSMEPLAAEQQPVVDYSMQPVTVHMVEPQQAPSGLVVGRRSHRANQQQQARIYRQYNELECGKGVDLIGGGLSRRNTHDYTQALLNQQPLAVVERHSASSMQVYMQVENSKANRDRARKQQVLSKHQRSLSTMNIHVDPIDGSYNLPPPMMQPAKQKSMNRKRNVLDSDGHHLYPNASDVTRSRRLHQTSKQSYSSTSTVAPASSCSSLCSTLAANDSTGSFNSSTPGGSSATNCPCCPPYSNRHILEPETCQDPCCSYDQRTVDSYNKGALVRAASCQQVVPSCCDPHQQNQLPKLAPSCYNHGQNRTKKDYPRQPNANHHHSCKANANPSTSTKSSAQAYRSSSCHRVQQPMLMSGRNVLPVHPKPKISQFPLNATGVDLTRLVPDGHRSRRAGGNEALEEITAVGQMYESLAAELKAKLGDLKMGPILLPPKDYDTMSRKQGKLSGIELRRSTNPQLVGPAANRLCTPNGHSINEQHATINEGQQVQDTSLGSGKANSAGCAGSNRSSGRSQHEDDNRSLQRSRSNSSSGLGSISMGAGSPDSSPSSKSTSSDDVRRTTLLNNSISANNYTTKTNATTLDCEQHDQQPENISPTDRKNGSPDTNCGSSDSGHSGSGRLDSGSLVSRCSEQQSRMSNEINSDTQDRTDKRSGTVKSDQNNPYKCAKQSLCESGNGVEQRLSSNCQRGKGIHNHNPSKVSDGILWNGRIEIPLKVNSDRNGNTYLATKQIIY